MALTRSKQRNSFATRWLYLHGVSRRFPRNYDVKQVERNNYLDLRWSSHHPNGETNYNFYQNEQNLGHALEDINIRTEGSFISILTWIIRFRTNI